MEQITRQIAGERGIPWVIIRPHNVFGPRQFCADQVRNVLGIFVNRAMRGEPLLIYGDGAQTRAFSYIEDSMPCYLAAVEGSSADGHVINIGGEIPVTLNEAAEAIQEAFPGTEIRRVPGRYGEVKHAFSSHEKARRLLGFEERIGWREGLRRMIEWAKIAGPWEWEPILMSSPTAHTPAHWASRLWD